MEIKQSYYKSSEKMSEPAYNEKCEKHVLAEKNTFTLAEALADGIITTEESSMLTESGKYARWDLHCFYKGNLNIMIKKELLEAGYTEKEIENFSKIYKAKHEAYIIKDSPVKNTENKNIFNKINTNKNKRGWVNPILFYLRLPRG